MRKTWLLGLLAGALVVIGLPAMAATTLGTSGELTYGIIDNGSVANDAWGNAYINFTATIDANNMVNFELGGWNVLPTYSTITGTAAEVAPKISNFYLKSDIGGDMAMMDTKTFDTVLYAGYGVFDLPDFNVTQYGPEGFAAMGVDTGWGDGMFGSEIGDAFPLIAINANVMGMVNIVAAASSTAFAATNQQALLGAYGTIGPVSFEGGWTLSGDSMGYIPLGVKFSSAMDPVSVSAMASYVLALDSAKYSNWSAGAAVTFAGSYTVDFAMLSYQPSYEPTVTALKGTGDVIVNITKTLGVIGSVYLNFDPNAAAAFDTVEVSAWTLFGPAKVRLGYLYGATGTDNLGTPNLNAPSNNGGKGGIFLTTDLAF